MSKRSSGKAGWMISGLAWGTAIGLAAGTLVIAPAMAPITNLGYDNVGGGASSSKSDGGEAEANKSADSANELLSQVSTELVAGTLIDKGFLIISTPDADPKDVDTIRWLAEQAGGINAGTIALTDKFMDSKATDELQAVVAASLPAGAQLAKEYQAPGFHAGEAVGAAVMIDPMSREPIATEEDRALTLGTLRDKGFLTFEDGTIKPAHGVIVVTGGKEQGGNRADGDFGAVITSDFAWGVQDAGGSAVLAGRLPAAEPKGALGLIRGNDIAKKDVSTVDSTDTETGRISTVLALAEQIRGGVGAYGSASTAVAPAPKKP
ncbi:copper transporter [Corynebacterium aquatimens]|uniref:Copper transporter n=1 Tax=Corynebacterium aquatimens TaxID=1190508 RepID=A0A931GVQ2_9CORY|nr:copper transporter [Corynebacterium aquatimens]MBG6121546.1 hypothetical protein [Corynebacterium aquatimens]WJY65913.1 Copper transporter MctB precursor [Corynebacterium aquatimens]